MRPPMMAMTRKERFLLLRDRGSLSLTMF